MERKVCLILEASNLGGRADSYPKANSPPTTDNQGARGFIDGGRGLPAETAQAAPTVTLKLVIGGLISVILIVLSTVSLYSSRVGLFPFL